MHASIQEAKSGDLPEATAKCSPREGAACRQMGSCRPARKVGRSFHLRTWDSSKFSCTLVHRRLALARFGRRNAWVILSNCYAVFECPPSSLFSSATKSCPRNDPSVFARVRLAGVSAALAVSCTLILACTSATTSPGGLREFTDEIGRSVRVRPNPERIVSLAPSVTETLYALGLGDRIVGVTSYCDYPPEAKSKESIGDTLRPSIERIVSLKPDLVLVSTASQLEQALSRLDELGIPAYVTSPGNLDSALKSIENIGELAGIRERALEVTAGLRRRIEAVSMRVAGRERPRVFFILGSEPLITAGGASFINDLIERGGGRSISADEKAEYPQFSLETAVARQPEVIFLQAGEDDLPPRLKQTPAALAGHVYRLDDALLLRPGPRIVDGLEQMAEKIHLE
jgi:iron complex transport system substrate-binding protein